MATSKKIPAFSFVKLAGTVAAIAATDKGERDALAVAITKQTEATTGRLVKGLEGAPKITDKIFDADLKAPLREALVRAGFPDTSVNAMVGKFKLAVIGITCGHSLPKASEGLQAYGKRIREDAIKAGDYTPSNAGGREAKATGEDAGKTVSRHDALWLLTKGDAADMQALDFMTQKHMDKIRALYAELAPAK